MKKVTLYSRSGRSGRPGASPAGDSSPDPDSVESSPTPAAPSQPQSAYVGASRHRDPVPREAQDVSPVASASPGARARSKSTRTNWWRQSQVWLASFATVMTLVVIAGAVHIYRTPVARQLTQKDIDAAVLNTLTTKQIPSAAARSYAAIRPSVVRIRGLGHDGDKDDIEKSVGSGVVIVDSGMILTNLHVVAGAEKLKVVFFDGSESDAFVVSTQPENDLAVVQAKTLPDDLVAATLRSTKDLAPGDEVIAVGFPFGIGPSVSSGIVSGLRREYRSSDGTRQLTNLIQFDAAANPGSSGGPLVTTDGAVVGIVTGILNRGDQRVFIGIGFAVPIENAAAGVGLAPF